MKQNNQDKSEIWIPFFLLCWRRNFYAKHNNAKKMELMTWICILLLSTLLFYLLHTEYNESICVNFFALSLAFFIGISFAIIVYLVCHIEILFWLSHLIIFPLVNWSLTSQEQLAIDNIEYNYYLVAGRIVGYDYMNDHDPNPCLHIELKNQLLGHKKNVAKTVGKKNPESYIGKDVLIKHSLKDDFFYILNYNINDDSLEKYSYPIMFLNGKEIGTNSLKNVISNPELFYKNIGLCLVYKSSYVNFMKKDVYAFRFTDIAQHKQEIEVKRNEIPESFVPQWGGRNEFLIFHHINERNDKNYSMCPFELYTEINFNFCDYGILFNDTIYTLSKVERQCPQIKKYLNEYIKRNSEPSKKYNKTKKSKHK